MNNEEPIEMSHFPDGRPGDQEGTVRPIERDDFPAPQFLYADEARRRRWSEPMKKEEELELENQQPGDELEDKLKSQEKELRKISTGSSLGKVFLDTVKQREKINAGKERERDCRLDIRTN